MLSITGRWVGLVEALKRHRSAPQRWYGGGEGGGGRYLDL